jgi:hypothetical protein
MAMQARLAFMLLIVAFGENGDTGGDAYDTLDLATFVALTRVPPSSQNSSVSSVRNTRPACGMLECLSGTGNFLNNNQVCSR